MALKFCAAPGCAVIVTAGRCAAHARAKDRARGTAVARGYDYRWSLYSKRWLRAHPLCGERADGMVSTEHSRCAQAGRITAAECTDHIVPLSRGGDKWDPANHQSLCFSCNVAKGNK